MNALLFLLLFTGAPRTPYGGGMVAYVWGRSIATHPTHLATAADLTVQRALYEPLYSMDRSGKVVPNLAASLPQQEGNRITIELRPNLVAHDGSPVNAQAVGAWLTMLARRDSRASFVVLPIAGARERIAGKDVPLRVMALGETTLLVELVHQNAELARLLASPHAGIGLPSGAGTGPFKIAASPERGSLVLVPFLEHFVGRPFLDRVELRPLASRFGTTAIARKEKAALVFETPDSDRIEPSKALRWPDLAHREVLVLSAGDRIQNKAAVVDALDAAVNRRRLASRYLDGKAEPTFAFTGTRGQAEAAPLGETLQATLHVAKEARAGQRFAERVQLDLHRAGIAAKIVRVSADELERLRMSGDYDLMLDVTLPDAPATSRAIDRLHALLSIAASYGRPDFVGAEVLGRFYQAKEDQRLKMLEGIETELRRVAGLVPLASRAPAITAGSDLANVQIAPDGSIDLADIFLREEP